jgi:hypothetical protein
MVAVGFMYFFIIFCGTWRCQYSVDVTGFAAQTDKEVACYCIETGTGKRFPIAYCFKCRRLRSTERVLLHCHTSLVSPKPTWSLHSGDYNMLRLKCSRNLVFVL